MPKNTRLCLSIEMVMMSLSGSLVSEIEAGVSTAIGSSGLNLAVRMKKVRSKKAMSHIAVMSSEMLFLGILTFAMVLFQLQNEVELLGFGTESLDDAETYFIDAVG